MRGVITLSGFFLSLTVIIMIHSTLVNENVRRMELTNGFNSAMDYAFDKMLAFYDEIDFAEYKDEAVVKNELIAAFCDEFSKKMTSDGEFEISFIEFDFQRAVVRVRVEDRYNQAVKGFDKMIFYEKTYSLV